MEQRDELVLLGKSGEFIVTDLCKRFAISRKTAHQWIDRYEEFGPNGHGGRFEAGPGATPLLDRDPMKAFTNSLASARPALQSRPSKPSSSSTVSPCSSRSRGWFAPITTGCGCRGTGP